MGKTYGKFKYNIGDTIHKCSCDLIIIDRRYKRELKCRNDKQFYANTKIYKYKCMKCGNEDEMREDCFDYSDKWGCNACCTPPKKIVPGINNVGVTAPWLAGLFKNPNDVLENSKYSKQYVDMVCPDCGRILHKQILQVMSNHGLSCPCSDGWSYPNKYMYALLEQIGVHFETEKHFDWSNNRSYDDYIEYKGLKIITEQHGKQHYKRPIIKGKRYRSTDDEKENDAYKEKLAHVNGIDYYFQIDCSKSESDYIKNSITNSGLLNVLDISVLDIDWNTCDSFASSNMIRLLCSYINEHPGITRFELAEHFHLCENTISRYYKTGVKHGWCNAESICNSSRYKLT